MHVSINDGMAVFPHKVFRATVDRKDESVRRKLGAFQVEADCIVCYTSEEAERAEAVLKELGISYSADGSGELEPQRVSEIRARVQGIKYASRSEFLEHIQQGKEPKSRELQALKERIEALEAEVNTLKQKLGLK